MLEERIEELVAVTNECIEALQKLTNTIGEKISCAPEKPITEKPVKEKKPRRTNAQIKADEAKITGEKPVETDLGLGTETPSEPEVTLQQLKVNGHRLVACGDNQEGLVKARELIAAYGAKMIDEVKSEDYSKLNAEFIKEAENWETSKPNTQL